jgi:hypothetical protein
MHLFLNFLILPAQFNHPSQLPLPSPSQHRSKFELERAYVPSAILQARPIEYASQTRLFIAR